MSRLMLVERLGMRRRRLLPMLVSNVEPTLHDEMEEVREIVRRIVEGIATGVSQNFGGINYFE
jgi:hypothetical protein